MGKHRNSGSKASHKKKRDQKFREKGYQHQRDVVKGNFDGLTVVSTDSNADISEKIFKAGPIDTSMRHIFGSMVFGGQYSTPISSDEIEESGVDDNEPVVEEVVDNGQAIIKVSKNLDLVGMLDTISEKQDLEDEKDNKKGVSSMFYSQRVKRGMVFWYSINPDVDKNSSPTIEVDGKKYIDSLEYGNRPWLVVSGDEINKKNRLCTIVPLSSSQSNYNDNSPNKVHIYFCGRDTTILCEQLRTVNSIELKEYASTLSDEVMELVDKGIMYAMGIKYEITVDSINMSEAMDKIDSVINGVIQNRIKQELEELNKGRQDVIDDMVLRISDGFESLYQSAIDGVRDDMRKKGASNKSSGDTVELEIQQVSVEESKEKLTKSQEDLKNAVESDKPFTSYSTRVARFYERYPNLSEGKDTVKEEKIVESKSRGRRAISRKTSMFSNVVFLDNYVSIDPPKKTGKKRMWDDSLLAQFAYDFKYLSYEEIMERWEIEDSKKVIDMAHKVERKLFTGNMNSKADFSGLKLTFPGRVISYV